MLYKFQTPESLQKFGFSSKPLGPKHLFKKKKKKSAREQKLCGRKLRQNQQRDAAQLLYARHKKVLHPLTLGEIASLWVFIHSLCGIR